MNAQELPWTVAAVAGAGRSWLASLLAPPRLRADHPQDPAGAEDSRLGLDERILATRRQIAVLHRSLAMHKLALVAQRARQNAASRSPEQRPASPSAPAAPRPDVPLDDDAASAYADTEPMSFLDSRPFMTDDGLPR